MNRSQIVRQIQSMLRAATWDDAEVAFAEDSVVVTLGMTEAVATEKRFPLVLIRPGTEAADPDMGEQPGLVRIEIVIDVVVANAQDQFGEVTLVGANRDTGSTGRGLLEVEELIKTTLLQKGLASGVSIILRSSSAAQPQMHSQIGYIAMCSYRFEVLGTTARTYQAPNGFTATGGSGQVSLAWNDSNRWDIRRFILRRASGATAPATSSSGTGVTLGGSPDGADVNSVTDTGLAAGVYSYALFAVYDDTNSDTDVAVSAAATYTSVTVA